MQHGFWLGLARGSLWLLLPLALVLLVFLYIAYCLRESYDA